VRQRLQKRGALLWSNGHSTRKTSLACFGRKTAPTLLLRANCSRAALSPSREGVAQTPAVRAVLDHPGMAQNFLTCDRDQPLLLPPDLHDWLEEDHLAWFVIEAIEELDLEDFYASYRADNQGRAAHDPTGLRLATGPGWPTPAATGSAPGRSSASKRMSTATSTTCP
jgi:hypothetical protein